MAATCMNGCVWLNGRWETVLGCPEHGHQIYHPEAMDLKENRLERDVVAHYTTGEIETIDFIFDKLGYEGGLASVLANIIKYGSRANHKGQRRSDIEKIRNYATIALQQMDKHGETS